MRMTLRRPLECWIKTMMARSTSESFVGVYVSWPDPTTRRRQAKVAREAKAKKKVNKKINCKPLKKKFFSI